ncbi:MAG: glycosyl hydrolase 115 family protein [Clostridia bacterium]|nr:glycosyl hydrolase 115 family protein [Clostridia bacterium]
METKERLVLYEDGAFANVIMDVEYESKNIGARSYERIYRAAEDLCRDIAMVAGSISYYDVQQDFVNTSHEQLEGKNAPQIVSESECDSAIIVGSMEHSEIIEKIISSGKFDEAKEIYCTSEAYAIKTIEEPIVGVQKALVIAGSDDRGTIYGIYDLSERLGVSPFYWFSDVAVEVKEKIAIDDINVVEKSPSVKYRGIFINDEERTIDWAKLKFPTENGTPDVTYYRHVFELLLRLKANTLWPAMHEGTTAFNMAKDEDGIPINAKEASRYGIIMASSHCEMMLRCNVSEWSEFYQNHLNDYDWQDNGSFDYTQNKEAILGYWRERLETNKDFESILSLGIRGVHDGDAETDNLASLYNNSKVEMMADVIAEQRKLIKEVYGSETAVPQVFIPYKGMADIYNDGLKDYIPGDVMLMWAEDNYGYVRQVPNETEMTRSGGKGIYYHISYWSWYTPKSYLWLNSASILLPANQMHRAYDTGASDYWVLNVGDIKPGETLVEFFLKMAYRIDEYTNDTIDEFLTEHAMRDYHATREQAEKIAYAASEFYRMSGIKKAEFYGHVSSYSKYSTYFSESMLNPLSVTGEGDEGMRMVNHANELCDLLEEIESELDEKDRAAFYQQIFHLLKSYRNVCEEYVYLWKNQMAAKQGRYNSAINYAYLSKAAIARIKRDEEYFHSISDGKWEKAIGYDHPGTTYDMDEGILLASDSEYEYAEAVEGLGAYCEGAESAGEGELRFDTLAENEHYVDIFATGVNSQKWYIEKPDYITASKTEGETDCEERVILGIDKAKKTCDCAGKIRVLNSDGEAVAEFEVYVTYSDIALEENSYAEANNLVVLEAEHFTESITGEDGSYWGLVENLGLSGDSMCAYPFDAERADGEDMLNSARLRYRIYFKSTGEFEGVFYRNPTLNEGYTADGEARECRTAVALDDGEPYILRGVNSYTNPKWAENIMRGIEEIPFTINVKSAGWHDLYIYRSDAGISFGKIVMKTGEYDVKSLTGPEISPNSMTEKRRKIGKLPKMGESKNKVIDICHKK